MCPSAILPLWTHVGFTRQACNYHFEYENSTETTGIATIFFSTYLQTSSKNYFHFLLVNHQRRFKSERNDRRFSPLAYHHAGRTAKPGKPAQRMPSQVELERSKRPFSLKRARRLSKKQPLVGAHQDPLGGPVHSLGEAELQCRHKEAGRWRTTEMSPGPSGASERRRARHAIPSPTVNVGTQSKALKHIICAHTGY